MLLIIKKEKQIKKKEFIIVVFNLDYKVFIIWVTIFNICSNLDTKVYPSKIVQRAYAKEDKVSIEVFSKYTDFANIFLSKSVVKLFNYMFINNYAIELIDNYQI